MTTNIVRSPTPDAYNEKVNQQVRNKNKRREQKRKNDSSESCSDSDSASSFSSSTDSDERYKKKGKLSYDRYKQRRAEKREQKRRHERYRHHDKRSRRIVSSTTESTSGDEMVNYDKSKLSGRNQSLLSKERGDNNLVDLNSVNQPGNELVREPRNLIDRINVRRLSKSPGPRPKCRSLSPVGFVDRRSLLRRSIWQCVSPQRISQPKVIWCPYVPFGFYFRPSEQDLLTYYLEIKIADPSFQIGYILEIKCVYELHPQILGKNTAGCYYYVEIENCSKATRDVKGAGKWIASTKHPVVDDGGKPCGTKRGFVFQPTTPCTDGIGWLMKEYSSDKSQASDKRKWVIYHIYQKPVTENSTPRKTIRTPTDDEGPSKDSKRRRIDFAGY